MASNPNGTPPVLLHHFKHNQVLHEQVVLLSSTSSTCPRSPPERRVDGRGARATGFYQVIARYGFMQTPERAASPRSCARARARHRARAHELLPRPRDAAPHRQARDVRAGARRSSPSSRATRDRRPRTSASRPTASSSSGCRSTSSRRACEACAAKAWPAPRAPPPDVGPPCVELRTAAAPTLLPASAEPSPCTTELRA